MMPGPIRRSRLRPAASLLPLAAASVLLLRLAACTPPGPEPSSTPTPSPTPSATPLPTPEPSPTPLYVPYKRLDTARLFDGIQLQTSFSTEPGSGGAASEAASPSSYTLHLDLHVRVPHAVTSQQDLATLNPALPSLLPTLGQWLQSAHVSPLYERLYQRKLKSLQANLVRLDQLLTRHDFFDCQTILEVQPPGSSHKLLWIQSDMDVDSDGSDPDRVPIVDGSSQTFQPITSYKWPKRGPSPNPFLPPREAHLLTLQSSLALATTPLQRQQLADGIEELHWEIQQLRANSFLVAATDPYIVIPGSLIGVKDEPFSPAVGDYCAIIYNANIYPAIIGDVGPSSKVGEASLRIAQQLNPLATSENRPVSALKITYLIFPGTADHPFAPPDLPHWHDRVDALLKEAGGCTAPLYQWTDLTVPPPTPTPAPTPTPTPTPVPFPAPLASPSQPSHWPSSPSPSSSP